MITNQKAGTGNFRPAFFHKHFRSLRAEEVKKL